MSLLDKIANPVLSRISKGQLRATMEVRVGPTADNRGKEVALLLTKVG